MSILASFVETLAADETAAATNNYQTKYTTLYLNPRGEFSPPGSTSL